MQEQFFNTAVSIGNSICRDAIRHNSQCNWVGVNNDIQGDNAKPYYAALKGSWYNGTSGIAWFLAQLSEVSGDKRHRNVALGAIEQALRTSDQVQHSKLGFHAGITGIAFSAVEVGEKMGHEDLVERGLQLLRDLHQLPESEYTLDVIDGCAGAIPAIIKINRRYSDPVLDTLLVKMGDYLLQTAQAESSGISWNTMPHGASANLTGYAHGAAGIALALLELWHYTQDERYKKAGLAGFAYEDACYDAEQENWPDFREGSSPRQAGNNSPRPCGCAWCHGAPGIGLARLRAFQLTGNEIFKQSGQIAVDTTLRLFGRHQLGNFSLCHGVFGNADLLLNASETTGDESFAQKVEEVAAEAIEQFQQRNIPFPNGTQSDFSAPDMMLGQAGVGYGFLRLADRKRFESVLLVH
ncbi:MAG: lanthionine synthetase LanC family protein [Saprospiraceae bacterium]